MARFLLASFSLSLAACSLTIEQRMAKAAEQINAEKPPNIESARSEGGKLIVRLVEMPSSKLSNEEAVRIATAGLCGLNDVRAALKQGGSFRFEIGNDFSGASAEVDR